MDASRALGALVLAGSGEYTPTMDIVDRYLLELTAGRRVLLIATACAMEGDDRMTWWEQLGIEHFRQLGVAATPVRIRDREEADRPENAEQVAEAGLVWFSGGTPAYLAQAFEGTLSWQALEAANRRGAVVAGASGGLGVLNAHVASTSQGPGPQRPGVNPQGVTGLGLAAPVRAMAHFDRMEARRPEFLEQVIANLAPGQMAVGVDEDTAVVWTESGWVAMGHKRVVVFEKGQERRVFRPGESVGVLPPPVRARPAAAK